MGLAYSHMPCNKWENRNDLEIFLRLCVDANNMVRIGNQDATHEEMSVFSRTMHTQNVEIIIHCDEEDGLKYFIHDNDHNFTGFMWDIASKSMAYISSDEESIANVSVVVPEEPAVDIKWECNLCLKCGEKPVHTSHGQCMKCEKYDPFDNTSSLFDDCYS